MSSRPTPSSKSPRSACASIATGSTPRICSSSNSTSRPASSTAIGWNGLRHGRATCRRKAIAPTFRSKAISWRYEQSEIALGEAQNMLDRLMNQTGPKILKSLEANVKAIEADKLTQDAAFNLETQRLERIRKNIKNCTLIAPTDGIVVYVNQTNRFGMVTAPIAEGVTVRQDQPIINLPDPLHMRVKARINESKLSLVQTGQPRGS